MLLSIGYVVSMIASYMYNFCHVKPYVLACQYQYAHHIIYYILIVIHFRHGHTYIDCSRLPSPNR